MLRRRGLVDLDSGRVGQLPHTLRGARSPIYPNSEKTGGPEKREKVAGSPFGVRIPRMRDTVVLVFGFVFQNFAGSSIDTVHLGHAQIRQHYEAVLYWECINVPGELQVVANDCVWQLHDYYVGSWMGV